MRKRKETAKRKALEIAAKTHRAFGGSIQIEDYLRRGIKEGHHFYVLEIKKVGSDCLGIEVSPVNNDDENNVYNAYVMRFNIEPKRAIDNMMKYLREKPLNEKIV